MTCRWVFTQLWVEEYFSKDNYHEGQRDAIVIKGKTLSEQCLPGEENWLGEVTPKPGLGHGCVYINTHYTIKFVYFSPSI